MKRLPILSTVGLLAFVANWAHASRGVPEPTWRVAAREADLVVIGKIIEGRPTGLADDSRGESVVRIEKTIVPQSSIGNGRDTFVIGKYFKPSEQLFFISVYIENGKFEIMRAYEISATDPLVDYIKGALAIKDDDGAGRVAYS